MGREEERKEEKVSSVTRIIMELIEREKPQNVQQLVSLMRARVPISESEVVKHVLKLQSQGKISLESTPQIFHSLGTYMRTKEAYWYWVVLILAVSNAVSTFTIPETAYPMVYVRYVLGTVCVLFLPGYSFLKALFPKEPKIKTSSKGLDQIERLALSFGVSMALVPMAGLILYYTPWGIGLTPIIVSLLTLTVMFATAGFLREFKSQAKQAFGSSS